MSHFAKRHYEAIATVIQKCNTYAYNERPSTAELCQYMQAQFSAMLQADNPQYDHDRFLFACRPGANVRAKTAHLKSA